MTRYDFIDSREGSTASDEGSARSADLDPEPSEASSRTPLKNKTRCEQTGNYYYGARYYNPTWSVWLSVDPWANKYPYVSPYNFVENNPIRLIDPDGNGPGDVLVVFGGGDPLSSRQSTKWGKGTMSEIAKYFSEQFRTECGSSNYYTSPLQPLNKENLYMDGLFKDRLDKLTQDAFDLIVSQVASNKNNGIDGQIVIAGFSFGGVLASHLTRRLADREIIVDGLVLLDPAYSLASFALNRSFDYNVKEVFNFYQEDNNLQWDNKIGSYGGAVTRFDGTTNGIHNMRIETPHEKVDDVTMLFTTIIIDYLLKNE